MAKKRATTRKTRQTAGSGSSSDHHPYRHNSKHISASPSVASSPSPQPHDLVQRRRKGTPVRSPSQGDRSKGIVFAFRIQPDSDLSMAVDILSYDQVSDEPESSSSSEATATASTASKAITEAVSAPSISSAAEASIGSVSSSSEGRESSTSSQLKLAGEKWSSDPSSYLSNNVVDLTRNVLILHSRKPQDTTVGTSSSTASSSASATPYSRSAVPSRSSSMSLPSTPPMTDSSSYSSASSSPSSSPSSPTLQPFEGVATTSEKEKNNNSFPEQLSSALPLSLPLPDPMVADLKSQPPRMLRVRGLGNGARRMQVFVV